MRPIKNSVSSIVVVSAFIGLTGVFTASRPSQAQDPADAHLALVKQYCSTCHSDKLKTGGVSFEGITAASVAKDPELFEKAVRKLRGRVMPPPGAKQPDGKAIDSLVRWLEDSLDKLPNQARITDQVVLHRLNRTEYQNSVRDLLLVDVNAADALPPDDIAQGFDNIASALQVSPSFIEQYVHAAHNVAVEALGKRDTRAQGWTFRAGPGNQLTHVPGLPLGTRGGILARVDLPADGEYHINIADIANGLWGSGLEYENPLVVTLDNKIVYQTVLGGEEDTKLFDQVQNGAFPLDSIPRTPLFPKSIPVPRLFFRQRLALKPWRCEKSGCYFLLFYRVVGYQATSSSSVLSALALRMASTTKPIPSGTKRSSGVPEVPAPIHVIEIGGAGNLVRSYNSLGFGGNVAIIGF